ncbi:enolase C-terminal domain-like protein [Kitasatospora sp. NPDC001540]|uniref:enolase C-terminal domain-like protein n=1 Tax=Kitasatospora sp. NPDC001540 TaxID=3364014 RepID=UPI0036A1D62A
MSESLRLSLHRARVSARTTWWVAALHDADGRTGLGECSDAGPGARRVWARAGALLRAGAGVPELAGHLDEDAGPDLARHTVLGALESALADLRARRAGQPLWQALGGAEARPVHRYANINRALRTRTPQEFAEVARAAEAAGYRAVKCAPFDGLPPGDRLRKGLVRARAVRRALRPATELMVDAHLLLDVEQVLRAAPALAALDLRWLEDAVPLDDPDALAAVHAAGIAPLAGGEFATGPEQVRAALHSGHLAWLLPDVKHSGGLGPARRLAEAARAAGARVSLHNPAGPVATAAGLHLAAALGPDTGAETGAETGTEIEFAFGEARWRGTSVVPAEPAGATAWLTPPPGPGLGLDLTARHWRPVPLPRLDGALR